jgi:hypothetical protein
MFRDKEGGSILEWPDTLLSQTTSQAKTLTGIHCHPGVEMAVSPPTLSTQQQPPRD